MSYAKLFCTITDSSLWGASKDARILFVSLLARADATGFVEAALPGLSRMANLTLAETESALADLMAPDPYSKSTEHEGRRVVAVPRGWCLVNYESYRERRDEEERRDYMRDYMQKYRQSPVNIGKHSVNTCKLPVNSVNKCKPCKPPLAKAEAEAEAEAENTSARARALHGAIASLPPIEMTRSDGDDALFASTNSNLPVPDSLRWMHERSKPWARELIKAGAKIGQQNWPVWQGLCERHTHSAILAAVAAVAPDDRWPDKTEKHLTASRGQIDLTTATKRKTITLGQR